jgi:tyrosyl-tRNA synthetase
VSIFHSPEAANAARERWDEVFRGGSGIPEDIPEALISEEERVTDILRRLDMVSSGKEAKRLIDGGGIRLDGEKVEDQLATIKPEKLPAVLQVGKRKFVRLVPS